MQLLIESTDVITTVEGQPVRLWRGTLEDGTPVDVFVARIGTADPHAQEILARALRETPAPREVPLGNIVDLRKVL